MFVLLTERGYKGPMIAIEEQSLSGSTVGLLRSDSIRTNTTNLAPAAIEEESFQASSYPTQPVMPKSESDTDNAPIISLPVKQKVEGAGDGAIGVDGEIDMVPDYRRKARPLAQFDQFPVIPDPEI